MNFSNRFLTVFSILISLSATYLITGCNYENSKNIPLGEEPKTWFAFLQKNIFLPKCTQCHNPQKVSAGLDVSSYETWMISGKIVKNDSAGSLLFQSIKSGRMPMNLPKLSDEEIQSIGLWIDQGANPSTPRPQVLPPPVPVPSPPVLEATYSSIRKLIFEVRCVTCHSGPEPTGALDLTTYRALFATSGVVIPGEPLESRLSRRLINETDPMPPRPRPRVTEAEIIVIETWIKNGALEN